MRCCKYLAENYDLSRCTLVGASAGALAATLCACEVDFEEATQLAYRLAEENNAYTRPMSLAGIWGSIIRTWLEKLLPEDCDEICSSWVKICVFEVFRWRRVPISKFNSKQEVIDCLMASVSSLTCTLLPPPRGSSGTMTDSPPASWCRSTSLSFWTTSHSLSWATCFASTGLLSEMSFLLWTYLRSTGQCQISSSPT